MTKTKIMILQVIIFIAAVVAILGIDLLLYNYLNVSETVVAIISIASLSLVFYIVDKLGKRFKEKLRGFVRIFT